ncbi:hypothetical protein EVJ58_g6925 [Rhodofomes roseus]|uniref:Uncharacterized protein n=1 Tax=Rhodofomes roseus TaxID=34475 RepID=A0A4Y9Y6C9_9APHY|nr:hypothetical protein EVJ58_g6925 [Rhodofomes roseus]
MNMDIDVHLTQLLSSMTLDGSSRWGSAGIWLRGQLQAGQYATTGGDYLEIILTHRDAFYAFPDGHRTCAIGFSDIALDLERRETRPDRESDPEAAAAFRHEAIVIASSGIWSQPTI